LKAWLQGTTQSDPSTEAYIINDPVFYIQEITYMLALLVIGMCLCFHASLPRHTLLIAFSVQYNFTGWIVGWHKSTGKLVEQFATEGGK
jgi:hypothetical protein